jgi:hypothetical protein
MLLLLVVLCVILLECINARPMADLGKFFANRSEALQVKHCHTINGYDHPSWSGHLYIGLAIALTGDGIISLGPQERSNGYYNCRPTLVIFIVGGQIARISNGLVSSRTRLIGALILLIFRGVRAKISIKRIGRIKKLNYIVFHVFK